MSFDLDNPEHMNKVRAYMLQNGIIDEDDSLTAKGKLFFKLLVALPDTAMAMTGTSSVKPAMRASGKWWRKRRQGG
jgi:hypothetical protein